MAQIKDAELQQTLNDSTLANFRKNVGMLFYQRSQFNDAEHYFVLSENSYRKANMLLQATQMLANQAVLKELKGNYKEAIEIYLETSVYFRQSGDSSSLASALSNIGVVYEEMGLAEKAIYYDKKGLQIKLKLKDTLSAANSYNNIGVAFNELLNQPDSALFYHLKAFAIYRSNKQVEECAISRTNLAMMYIELNQFDAARQNLNRAYHVLDSINNLMGKAISERIMGELLFAEQKEEKAIRYFNRAYNTFKALGDKKSLMEMSSLLAKVYISMGRYPEATQIMQYRNALKDTLMNTENQAIIAEMESKYQLKEKNKTIEVLRLEEELQQKKINNQTIFITSLIIIFILTLIIFYFSINKNKLNQKQLRLELQNYLLRIGKLQLEIDEKGDCSKFSEEKLKQFDLSEREAEVLKYIAQGYKNSEIAEKLFISQNTIKTHIKNIYVKLDVKNRVEALKRVDVV